MDGVREEFESMLKTVTSVNVCKSGGEAPLSGSLTPMCGLLWADRLADQGEAVRAEAVPAVRPVPALLDRRQDLPTSIDVPATPSRGSTGLTSCVDPR